MPGCDNCNAVYGRGIIVYQDDLQNIVPHFDSRIATFCMRCALKAGVVRYLADTAKGVS